jgi:lipoyl-dependent peroxiredoxin
VGLGVAVPDLPRDRVGDLVAKAHRRCPYSRATEGNVDVQLTVV